MRRNAEAVFDISEMAGLQVNTKKIYMLMSLSLEWYKNHNVTISNAAVARSV
jgi:hypothetical protein